MASGILVCIAPVNIIFIVLSISNFPYVLQANPESGKKKICLCNQESWSLESEIQLKESRESHEQLETGVQVALTQKRNPRRAVQNSKTFLDSLTCGDKSHTESLCLVHAAGLLASCFYFVGALLGAKAMTFM